MAIFKGLVKVLKRIFVGKESSSRSQRKRVRRIPVKKSGSRRKKSLKAKRNIPKVRSRPSKLVKKQKKSARRSIVKNKPRKSKSVRSVKLTKPGKPPKNEGKLIGDITHYFSKIQVVVIKVSGSLRVGDRIQLKGASTDFIQTVSSMQIESVDVKEAHKGQLIGLKVAKIAKVGDKVYKL